MFESSLEYLHCVNCKAKNLDLKVLKKDEHDAEIIEGFVTCKKCLLEFPIIVKVPILWNDFLAYLTSRPSLGGLLLTRYAKTDEMRSYIKESLNKIKKKNVLDRYKIEERWVEIYENNKQSEFYNTLKSYIHNLPRPKLVVEHGCSVGLITNYVSGFSELVFGIDSSFRAILAAKKRQLQQQQQPQLQQQQQQQKRMYNTDYFVSDSVFHPFGNQSFDMVIALNLLDIIEPKKLLPVLSDQTRKNGFLILSDPYDYQRGYPSVKEPMYETDLRDYLHSLGFKMALETEKPSFVSWPLKLNSRATLEYKTDVLVSKKLYGYN